MLELATTEDRGDICVPDKNVFIEELEAMRRRMEELFLRNFEAREDETGPDTLEDGSEVWTPPADIIDSGQELTYLLDLPGILEQDLTVECRADRLWVHGARREDVTAGDVIAVERPKGPFSRIFKLPCPIREDAIRAEFKKGVLRIVVPRQCSAENRVQKVPVRQED